nr:RibD C-terminal domain protein [uncultured bacterium]
MKITLVDAISINGKITKGEHDMSWLSNEDQTEFARLRDQHDVIVLDRKSYESYHPRPQNGKLRLVLTHHPELFIDDTVPGQLEFVVMDDVKTLVAQLQERGCKKLLVAGGGSVAADFLEAGVVNEVYVTLEPVLFGQGKTMLAERTLNVHLKLKSVKQLNETGTLFIHYEVSKVDPGTRIP